MDKISKIIQLIDEFLNLNHQYETTPTEVSPYLEKKGILKDSRTRKGKPLRDLLRKGKIPHAYQVGRRWIIPKSNINFSIKEKEIEPKKNYNKDAGHKLVPIANLISYILEKKYGKKAEYILEYKPNWLKSIPNKDDLKNKWEIIKKVYSELNENILDIETQLEKIDLKKKNRTQSFDIWFNEPYNFAVEFDERQHFNQFRKITLNYYNDIVVDFDIEYYKTLNNKIIKPGTSGFTKLGKSTSLFPELLKGERQDNRIRQRAFRDLLKDITPVELGFNPTFRIPYHVTNMKIKDFDKNDLIKIVEYVNMYNLLEIE